MEITTLLNKDLKRNPELLKEVKKYIDDNNLDDRFSIDNPDLMINVYPDEMKLNRLDENRNAFLTNSNEVVEIY